MTITPPIDLAPATASVDVDVFAVPTGREEEWRFTPMSEFSAFFEPVDGAGVVRCHTAGPYVGSRERGPLEWLPTNRAAAIALEHCRQTVVVELPPEAAPDEAIVVDLRADAPFAYQQVQVVAGRHSRATVIVQLDTSADITGSVVVDAADGADLTVVVLLDKPSERRLLLDIPASVGRDAHLVLATVALGGRVVRLQPSVRYAGPGGSAELLGVFLAEGDQFVEQRVFVEHDQPHCVSRVAYKGALSGASAHSVWVGDVLVRRSAVGTDTYQLNRNLLLTDGPRADSVPNLELETGDVAGAGHASATGRFDDDQLFYLMARGIPEERARQLVVRGFFADVVGRIPSIAWRDQIMARIEQRLGLDHEDE